MLRKSNRLLALFCTQLGEWLYAIQV